ncbi:prealbumin-like fold domain-containing protein [Enterococcus rivorum]|uniref:prealbumin-like fold domain-containing protein n=1 Tax=Enterococcus rivorum TaxID=762845 RepID=UPI003641FAAF
MKRTIRWMKGLSIQRKLFLTILSLMMVIMGVFTGTYAWQSLEQKALNTGNSIVNKREVFLLKLARDKDGMETTQPIAGTTFYLFQETPPKDTQIGGIYTTDKDGKISVKLPSGNYYLKR